ncbi:hypothetical protein BDF20DRAFT_835214 [Mycotypha africana]|uniref:uncharacterized protein n=1 Tax=Mycotypha africana TaxID=64632 RepID=UPI0023009FE4|nr:uncharacterized protein BDF20DRAFT_835214 [Mycotypha africana]KAI8979156.1 hypothetical protein BDF20DRAFT_835214 [Mycotypha africana]
MPSREAKRYFKRKLERKKREIAEGMSLQSYGQLQNSAIQYSTNVGICKDCGEVGHINKKSYKCQLYDASKKRKARAKDDYETKAAKARGKKKKLEDSKKRAELLVQHLQAYIRGSSLKTHPMKGYSDSLAAACLTLATTSANFMVENFENRLKHYA